MRISILGASGSMGLLVSQLIEQGDEDRVVAKVSKGDAIERLLTDTDVVIDFSSAEALTRALRCGVSLEGHRIPIVSGTTGLKEEQLDLMAAYSAHVPVFHSPNMSLLVAVLNQALKTISKALGNDFDVAILDIHHKLKKDSPSGTAMMFAKTIACSRDQKFSKRSDFPCIAGGERRKKGHICFASQRYGDIVGTHEITFSGRNESIKLRHEACSKEIFASGAIKIAHWLITQPNGLYNMDDYAKSILYTEDTRGGAIVDHSGN